MKKIIYLLIFYTVTNLTSKAQSTLYDINTIQKMEIFFSQSDWDAQLDSIKLSTDGYLKADSIIINGKVLKQPGIKFKGNSSYDSTFKKNPFTISLDKYKNNDYDGYSSLKLSNCFQDPSMVREVLSYQILQQYMECPMANFTTLTINNQYIGLYSNIEDITKTFCATHFNSNKSNTFIKCNPIITPGPNVKSNLKYITSDSNDYTNYYELKSNAGMNELVALCSTATYNTSNLEQTMDMDRLIWMLAFNNIFVNLDSYTGAFAQNYYLFKDNNSKFNPIIWDLNMSFGGFPFAGSKNSSLGTMSVKNLKELSYTLHEKDEYWPLINAVMNHPQWKKQYIAHMQTLLKENIQSGSYITQAKQLQNLIKNDVYADSNKFYSNSNFDSSLILDISAGNYFVPGIQTLMDARNTYLTSVTEFNYAAPVFGQIYTSPGTSIDSLYINVYVNNATDVLIGNRISNDRHFVKTPMYDDGNHHDGAANDMNFGTTISYNYQTTEFYFYAENSLAGKFSPERAEHEFYQLKQINSVPTIQQSDFTFYPNPTKDQLNIYSTSLKPFYIYNATGQLIYQSEIKDHQTISTNDWAPGIYTIQSGLVKHKLVVIQ